MEMNKEEVLKLVKSMPDGMIFWASEWYLQKADGKQYHLSFNTEDYDESIGVQGL